MELNKRFLFLLELDELREKLFEGLSGMNKKLKKLKLDFLLGSEKDLSSVYSNISKIIKKTFEKLIKK